MDNALIYEAINKTMADIGSIGKNNKNTYDNYQFRGIDDVMNALYPAMVKNKIFVAPEVLDSHREERVGSKGTNMMYSILTIKYTFYTVDGSSVSCVVVGEAMDRSDKSTNKAMSAAFKYACFQTFCIPTKEMMIDSEIDSEEIGHKVTPGKATPEASQEPDDPKARAAALKQINDWLEKINAECERTGVPRDTVFAAKKITDPKTMTKEQFDSIMRSFAKTPDKAVA